MQLRSTPRHTLIALLGAAGLVAGSGIAAAQLAPTALPGTDDSTVQITVGADLAIVVVNDAGADATQVTGTFTNNSDATLTCQAPGGASNNAAGTVTDAALVDRSLAYLAGNTLPPAPPLPGLNTGSLDVMLASGSLGSLGLGDDAPVELDAIQQAQDQARLAGHYGTFAAFNVATGDTVNWAATLTVPSGDRTDFNAAALVTCSQNGQWYAFAGYEDADDVDNGGGGGSLSMGSLGN